MRKQWILLFFVLWVSVGITCAETPPKPKLIIGIVVEQMRYDYLSRFDSLMGSGGFKRMISEGTDCKNAFHNYFPTQSASGHATIVTGSMPQYHGIIGDKWYGYLKNKEIFCTEDENESSVGGASYEAGKMSPRNLFTTTFGDELRLSSQLRSKVVSISMDPAAAILSGGHTAKEVYWYDDASGEWITSTYYKNGLDLWVRTFNESKMADFYLQQTWAPKFSLSAYTNSLNDSNPFETGINGQSTFPYDFQTISKPASGVLGLLNNSKNERDYAKLRMSPMGNSFTKDFAVSAILNLELGKDDDTDYLLISFSSLRAIGDLFGPSSIEVADAFARLDEDLSVFLRFVDEAIGKDNVLIYLTSDQGVSERPEYLSSVNLPAGVFSSQSAVSLLKSYLNIMYGEGEWVKSYSNQQIYLNHLLIEDKKMDLEKIQNTAAQFLLQFSGVSNTVTASALNSVDFTGGVLSTLQNGFHPKRSGDIIINLLPGWVEKGLGTEISSKSPYNYDTHVPLLWYGWRIPSLSIEESVEITDIAPTLSYLLGISAPNASTGKPMITLIHQ
ncbi:MAG: alkaline phosphatase family protein [Bacteroidales bacterium]|nr:alkaline phosphatase family protein [Bacteroidales bacterium]